jgi:hypothetical protein
MLVRLWSHKARGALRKTADGWRDTDARLPKNRARRWPSAERRHGVSRTRRLLFLQVHRLCRRARWCRPHVSTGWWPKPLSRLGRNTPGKGGVRAMAEGHVRARQQDLPGRNAGGLGHRARDHRTASSWFSSGPSGCGKDDRAPHGRRASREISEGELKIGDRVVNNVAPRNRDIAMVFQSYALYPAPDVYDNIAFGLKLRKIDRTRSNARRGRRARARTWSRSRPQAALSSRGLLRQRVAMGRAMFASSRRSDGRAVLEPRREASRADACEICSSEGGPGGPTTIYVTQTSRAVTMCDGSR